MLWKCCRSQTVDTQHIEAGCVWRSLIKTRDVAADHQPDHVTAIILLALQQASALAVAQDNDAVRQLLDLRKAVRNVEDAYAARPQIANDRVEISRFVLGERRGRLVHNEDAGVRA